MTCYIQHNSRPYNGKQYASRDEAVADFCKPAWVGAAPETIEWISPTTFKNRGVLYELVDGDNPKVQQAHAEAARPAGYKAPTEAQRRLIDKLVRKGIGGGSISQRLILYRQGRLDRREVSRLIDEMLIEAQW